MYGTRGEESEFCQRWRDVAIGDAVVFRTYKDVIVTLVRAVVLWSCVEAVEVTRPAATQERGKEKICDVKRRRELRSDFGGEARESGDQFSGQCA